MDERAAFMRSIIAEPDDDTPRLVFADWLQEQGEDARAEFIRVQCHPALQVVDESALTYWNGQLGTPLWVVQVNELRRRERELFDIGAAECWHKSECPMTPEVRFRRGFVEAIQCSATNWLAHAETVLTLQPITEVTLTGGQVPWGRTRVGDGRVDYYLLIGLGANLRRGKSARLPGVGIFHLEIIRAALEAEWPKIRFTLPGQIRLDPSREQESYTAFRAGFLAPLEPVNS